MKLHNLSEQTRGTVFLNPEEKKIWDGLTEMVETILSEYPSNLFYKKKGILSWRIYRGSGVENPADDWEDTFGEATPIVEVDYDKFPSDPFIELSFYQELGIGYHHRYRVGAASWTDGRQEIEPTLRHIAPLIRQALTDATS